MRSNKSILPRTSGSSYAQVDGSNGRRFPWKKVAIGAGVLLGLVWLIGPRGHRDTLFGEDPVAYVPEKTVHDGYEDQPPPFPYDPPQHKPPPKEAEEHPSPPLSPPAKEQPPKTSTDTKIANPPVSPETDPDPTKSVYCPKPFSSSKRIVQYALMIDAGSQGSRIHVYKFNNCAASSALEYEVFEQTRPGLSAYAGDATAAAESLDTLMDVAMKTVPESLRKCTPVAVKATAGLRLLGSETSAAILASVHSRLSSKYPFPISGGKDGVAIMDGKDEGVYAWITVNYLLGTIGSSPSSPKSPSYAVLDLGGASTQIVFEPTFKPSKNAKESEGMHDGDHKYELKFGGKTHVLYQHSYLGYGLMRARQSVHNLVAFMGEFGAAAATSGKKGKDGDDIVHTNPCIAQGTERVVGIKDAGWRADGNITMKGGDVGSWEACNRIVELVMAKDAICEVKPCSFNGAYQPSIISTFPSGGILTLSYFVDRILPLLPASGSSSPTNSLSLTPHNTIPITFISTLAKQVCAGPTSWASSFPTSTHPSALAELKDRPEMCLDLTFMHALLRLGYEFDGERAVRLEKKLDGVELGWALGAGIALVDAEIVCKV